MSTTKIKPKKDKDQSTNNSKPGTAVNTLMELITKYKAGVMVDKLRSGVQD